MHFVDQGANLLNLNPDVVAMVQHDLGISKQPHTGSSARHDDGASLQGGSLGQESNRLGNVVDHVPVLG